MRRLRILVAATLLPACVFERNPAFALADASSGTTSDGALPGEQGTSTLDTEASRTGTSEGAVTGSEQATDSEAQLDVAWYMDADADGYGDPSTEIVLAEAPPGHVDNAEDCDDTDPRINPDGLLCPSSPSLIGWWRFMEPARGRYFVDAGPSGRSLEAFGPSGLVESSPYGQALEFTGSQTYLDASQIATAVAPQEIPPSAFTIEVWANPAPDQPEGTRGHLVYFGWGGDGYGDHPEFHLSFRMEASAEWEVVGVSDGAWCTLSAPAQPGAWTHLAVVVDDDRCLLYVDGSLLDEGGHGPLRGPWVDFFVARSAITNRPFLGRLDDLMVFSEARAPFAIQADCGPECP